MDRRFFIGSLISAIGLSDISDANTMPDMTEKCKRNINDSWKNGINTETLEYASDIINQLKIKMDRILLDGLDIDNNEKSLVKWALEIEKDEGCLLKYYIKIYDNRITMSTETRTTKYKGKYFKFQCEIEYNEIGNYFRDILANIAYEKLNISGESVCNMLDIVDTNKKVISRKG